MPSVRFPSPEFREASTVLSNHIILDCDFSLVPLCKTVIDNFKLADGRNNKEINTIDRVTYPTTPDTSPCSVCGILKNLAVMHSLHLGYIEHVKRLLTLIDGAT